jgi:hypothetical protein
LRGVPDNGTGSDRRYDGYRGGQGITWRGIGYGGGGASLNIPGPGVPEQPVDGSGTFGNATANRGGGGAGFYNYNPTGGYSGGSGVVIVYWYE